MSLFDKITKQFDSLLDDHNTKESTQTNNLPDSMPAMLYARKHNFDHIAGSNKIILPRNGNYFWDWKELEELIILAQCLGYYYQTDEERINHYNEALNTEDEDITTYIFNILGLQFNIANATKPLPKAIHYYWKALVLEEGIGGPVNKETAYYMYKNVVSLLGWLNYRIINNEILNKSDFSSDIQFLKNLDTKLAKCVGYLHNIPLIERNNEDLYGEAFPYIVNNIYAKAKNYVLNYSAEKENNIVSKVLLLYEAKRNNKQEDVKHLTDILYSSTDFTVPDDLPLMNYFDKDVFLDDSPVGVFSREILAEAIVKSKEHIYEFVEEFVTFFTMDEGFKAEILYPNQIHWLLVRLIYKKEFIKFIEDVYINYLDFLQRQAKLGSSQAEVELARGYFWGKLGLEKDTEKAYNLCLSAKEKGNEEAAIWINYAKIRYKLFKQIGITHDILDHTEKQEAD